MMKCGGRCENVKLQMGDYRLKIHMFAIDMEGCDIVLGGTWLRTLGLITTNFKELYMNFFKDSHTHLFQCIKEIPPKIVSSHRIKEMKFSHYFTISFHSKM